METLRKAKPKRAPGRQYGQRPRQAVRRPRLTAREILRFLEAKYPEVLADLLRSRAEAGGAEPERGSNPKT